MPHRLVTERMVIRVWEPRDAPLLKAAIDASLPELRAWMPWAAEYPKPVEEVEQRIVSFRERFDAGEEFTLGILSRDESEALGSTGFHLGRGPDALEIGYWIRSDLTGRGLATEASRELTRAAFEEIGVARVEIRCDRDNGASAAVPRRLGYRLRETLPRDQPKPDGTPRDTLVWEITRAEFAARPGD